MTLWRRRAALATVGAALGLLLVAGSAAAYPPGVGILGQSRSCTSCPKSDGPWSDEARTIIDVLDAKTRRSLKGSDGVFQIEVARGERRTVLTLIGRLPGDAEPPRRHAWLYVDPGQITTSALSKFAPGWDVDLPMSCRTADCRSCSRGAKSSRARVRRGWFPASSCARCASRSWSRERERCWPKDTFDPDARPANAYR